MRAVALSAALMVLIAPPEVHAANYSLIGEWTVADAVAAPWTPEERHAALTAAGKRLIDVTITFKSSAVVSKHKPWACKRARYEPTSYPADAMFQGNLPEPNPAAVAGRFGFPKGDISGVDVRCTSGLFSYHFRDRNSALTALSNVIYTLKRK